MSYFFARRDIALREQGLFSSFQTKEKEQEIQKSMFQQVAKLSSLVRLFSKKKSEIVINRVQKQADEKYTDKKISFYLNRATESIEFEAEDIAEDCFHLSHLGHKKMAQVILNSKTNIDFLRVTK